MARNPFQTHWPQMILMRSLWLSFGALEASVGGFLVFKGGVSDFGGFLEGFLLKNDLNFNNFRDPKLARNLMINCTEILPPKTYFFD